MDTRELRKAYRALASKLHPDAQPPGPTAKRRRRDAAAALAALTLALQVLSDADLRRAYERSCGDVRALGSGYDALADFLEARRAEEEKEERKKRTRRRQERSPSPSGGGSTPSAAAPPNKPPPAAATPAPQLDVYTVTGLTPSEAVTGAERLVEFSARRVCGDCGGRGVSAAALASARPCVACGGRGRVALRRWAAADGGDALLIRSKGTATTATASMGACPACAGRGLAAAPPPCPACRGKKLKRAGAPAPQQLRLRVPAGVVDGQVLRVRGYGHDEVDEEDEGAAALEKSGDSEEEEEDEDDDGPPSPSWPPSLPRRRRRGDLYVRLDVHLPLDGSAGFTRVPGTDDVTSELRLCLFDALLGAEVGVATVRGETRLRIPPGTQHGARLALRGGGVARVGGGAGDHVFKVVVVVPRPGELAFGEGEKEEEEEALRSELKAAAEAAGKRRRRRA